MRFALNTLSVVAGLVLGAQAAIVGIAPFTAPHNATAKSTISVTFQTAPTFAPHEDYGVVYGVGTALDNSRIGTAVAGTNLVASGQSSNGGSNITINNISLPSSNFPTAGNYTIAAGVMYADGPSWVIGSTVFYQILQVTK